MTIWAVGFSCHEDTGDYGYFSDEARARAVCAEKQADVGKWTNTGDCIQSVTCRPIEVDGPLYDPFKEFNYDDHAEEPS